MKQMGWLEGDWDGTICWNLSISMLIFQHIYADFSAYGCWLFIILFSQYHKVKNCHLKMNPRDYAERTQKYESTNSHGSSAQVPSTCPAWLSNHPRPESRQIFPENSSTFQHRHWHSTVTFVVVVWFLKLVLLAYLAHDFFVVLDDLLNSSSYIW